MKREGRQAAKQTSQPFAGYNITLDPGHGGVDSGALRLTYEKEKVLALDLSQVIAQKRRDEIKNGFDYSLVIVEAIFVSSFL